MTNEQTGSCLLKQRRVSCTSNGTRINEMALLGVSMTYKEKKYGDKTTLVNLKTK